MTLGVNTGVKITIIVVFVTNIILLLVDVVVVLLYVQKATHQVKHTYKDLDCWLMALSSNYTE